VIVDRPVCVLEKKEKKREKKRKKEKKREKKRVPIKKVIYM